MDLNPTAVQGTSSKEYRVSDSSNDSLEDDPEEGVETDVGTMDAFQHTKSDEEDDASEDDAANGSASEDYASASASASEDVSASEDGSDEGSDDEGSGDDDDDEEEEEEEEEGCSDEDYSDDDDEGSEGYKKGGYHPVKVGEVYNRRYLVLKKLGWGHFSTVWLVRDSKTGAIVALKVQKSAEHYTEAAYDEIELLKATDKGKFIKKKDNALRDRKMNIVTLIDSFEHEGPHGKHVCMVFEALGENLLSLIKRYNYAGIPLNKVRNIAMKVAEGLDYLHRGCKIIHTDLKPENILLDRPTRSYTSSVNGSGGTGSVNGEEKNNDESESAATSQTNVNPATPSAAAAAAAATITPTTTTTATVKMDTMLAIRAKIQKNTQLTLVQDV